MTSYRVQIGKVTHDRFAFWGKDNKGHIRSRTVCGVFYTYKRHEASEETPLGVGVGRQDIDCMACLVTEARRW